MERLGQLHCLLTSYPFSKVAEWGIPRSKVKTCISLELANRAIHKSKGSFKEWAYGKQHEAYDRWAAKNIPLDSDIVIGWSSSFFETLRKCKANQIKTVVERGSSHILYQKEILENQFNKRGIKFTPASKEIINRELSEYEESDYISIPSKFVENTFIEKGINETKLLRNPYGVDLNSFSKNTEKNNKETFIIVCCGQLSLRKGTLELIEAFLELNLKNSELWLIGGISDELRDYFLGFRNENVKLLGTFPQNELADIYSKADVFCLNSFEEGLAMVIPQAMSCSLPVICSYNTGGSEIVEHGKEGFIYGADNVDEMKEAILKFYNNRDLVQKMGEAARGKVESGYTWDDYGDRMLRLYEKVLNK